ncbi:hypothetical protein [Rhodococcus sp. NCIMB 12038]|uniref:hypothetical protein n=1 Tax=Rhodococcus sp. NCIMB 12038 TaxID=933800 RepID=UPI000B3BE067|nr:hypothetical protein [Rhodococcus sp. NCIMB 12038]OUS97275.1 hypothetical protein CA951_02710 [Rhodococcus sp. NCIMB 12038]
MDHERFTHQLHRTLITYDRGALSTVATYANVTELIRGRDDYFPGRPCQQFADTLYTVLESIPENMARAAAFPLLLEALAASEPNSSDGTEEAHARRVAVTETALLELLLGDGVLMATLAGLFPPDRYPFPGTLIARILRLSSPGSD